MEDIFFRKLGEKRVNVYSFEKNNKIVAYAERTSKFLRHRLTIKNCDNEVYTVRRSKGLWIMDFMGVTYRFYGNCEFEIKKNNSAVGKIRFYSKKIIVDYYNDVYTISSHKEGYYSIKKNNIQVALMKKHRVIKDVFNKYWVLYESEFETELELLNLLLSVNDYFFYCDDWESGMLFSVTYSKKDKATDDEIYWRPKDYNMDEDKLNLEKTEGIKVNFPTFGGTEALDKFWNILKIIVFVICVWVIFHN